MIVAILQTIGCQITILQVDFEVVLDIRLDIYVAELIGQVKVNRRGNEYQVVDRDCAIITVLKG